MTHRMAAARTFLEGRGFSSSSARCGLGGHRTYVASVGHLAGNRYGAHSFSSQSLSNMRGSRRFPYGGIGDYGDRCYGDHDCGSAGFSSVGLGGRMGHHDPRTYYSGGNCEPSGGSSNYRGDGIHGVKINENLLKPLHVGVDPQEQEVRNQEREEMKNLNNQFACLIDKVQYLEQQNQVLVTKWNLLQQCALPAKKSLEPYYESFICDMKKQLEGLVHDGEHLASEEAAVQQLVEELKCKHEEEFKRRTSAENEFVLLKKDVDTLALSKAELEGKVDLLRRELEFRRHVYMEELAQLNSQLHDTNILLEMDNSRGLNIDLIIRNVEAWYQSVVQRSKEEANSFYENRFQELQDQKGKYAHDLKITQHEIANLSRLVHKLESENNAVKKQVDTLQTAICDFEQHGDDMLKDAREKLTELQTALRKAKDELATLLRDYQVLLNTKLGLDIEIATYKTLLEGEESRVYAGNHATVGVVKPSFMEASAGFPGAYGYSSMGGGYSAGHGSGTHGGYTGSYSSRSVGNHGKTASGKAAMRSTSADAEFYSGAAYNSRGASHSSDKPRSPAEINSSSTGREGRVGMDCGTGAGSSTEDSQGLPTTIGKGSFSGNIGRSCSDGSYLPGYYGASGGMPFGVGGMHPMVVGGPIAVGCNPGIAGGVAFGNMGIPAVGIPAGEGIGFRPVPCVGLGAPVGVCYPGAAVGAPMAICHVGGMGPCGNIAM